jgi:hypothetical protein
MSTDLLKRSAEGAAAGVAGTLVLQGVMALNRTVAPNAEAPEAEDPASFILWQVEKHLPKKMWMAFSRSGVESAAGMGLSLGYGATFGAINAALCDKEKSMSRAVIDGAGFGLAVWAVGYLGWLPMAKLMPPIWRQEPKQIAGPVIQHLAYGIATVVGYQLLLRKW